MLIRLIWIIEIGLGIWIASLSGLPYLHAHIGLGFTFALLMAILAIIGVTKKKTGLAVAAFIFAVLLPVVGLKQFPLKFAPALGMMQYLHVVIVLAAIGVAEALHSKIRKAA